MGHTLRIGRSAGRRGQALLAQGRGIRDRVCAGIDRMVASVWVLKKSAVTGRQPSSAQEIKPVKV